MELTRGAGRLARSAALGGAAVALALAAHVGAGAAAPSLGAIAVSMLLATVVTVLFAGRRLSRLGTISLLGTMQACLHTVFTCLAHPSPADTYSRDPSGHHMHATALGALPADAGMPPMDMSAGMILAHTGATVALALIIAHGESLLWSLAAYFGRRIPDRPAVAEPPRRIMPPAAPLVLTHQRIDPVPSRRGPPQMAFA